MKQYISYHLAIVFCLGMALQANAQKHKHKQKQLDYLVTNSNDTLWGKYQKKFLSQECFVVKGKKLLLDPSQYKAYTNNKDLYRSVLLSEVTQPRWMQCIESGKINLYQYVLLNSNHPGPTSTSVIWLAQKNGGPFLNVNGIMSSQETAEKNMENLLLDKPSLLKEFKAQPFNARTVQLFIHQYNH